MKESFLLVIERQVTLNTVYAFVFSLLTIFIGILIAISYIKEQRKENPDVTPHTIIGLIYAVITLPILALTTSMIITYFFNKDWLILMEVLKASQ